MKRKFPTLLKLVVFLSNGCHKKPQHVANLAALKSTQCDDNNNI